MAWRGWPSVFQDRVKNMAPWLGEIAKWLLRFSGDHHLGNLASFSDILHFFYTISLTAYTS